ncbi:heat shock protein Hsp70 family protein [Cavenderia fasciculata]|uniref:Heat shock protein Hsp70 family protein n=1 Tax=Cavenderia fasciculata TaxID=261658 RepID=F4QBQ3_CACFS|nr:heat shock protein Hsp70 family protein [Cavenderia fasciculata]EGG14641.1 heat shock protein Hsp70 family protein [Cavenderia fasciculata]|eukprot:XP_004351149.1 heat shock protein Hsp70 family protein [Cavenderia fasciculata]
MGKGKKRYHAPQKQKEQEPKEQPKEQKPTSHAIVGIDFGAHYSCVGVMKGDHVEICPNQQGNRTTPSIVAYVGDDRLVGDEAKGQIDRNPQNTVFDIKKLIGFNYSDPTLQNEIKKMPYKVVDDNDRVMVEVTYQGKQQTFAPVQIASLILAQIKHNADMYINADVKRAVITVPSEFTLEQRKVVKEAAQMAGLNVVRLISEHAAVALAYGYGSLEQQQPEQNIVVFDLGGSGLSVSVISSGRDATLELVANVFDHSLSGEAFDASLVALFTAEFKRKWRCDLSESARAVAKLKSACEKAKKNLSNMTQASIELDSLYEGYDLFTSVTRAKFEDTAGDLIRGARRSLTAAIEKAGIKLDAVSKVIMVGGGSRIPAIEKVVNDFFGGRSDLIAKGVPADEAVCVGASIQASYLEKHGSSHGDKKVVNGTATPTAITPEAIGIEGNGSQMVTIIPAKTRLPATRTFKLTNHQDNQTKLNLSIFTGSSSAPLSENRLISRYILDIEPKPKGQSSIPITFKISPDGLFEIITPKKTFTLGTKTSR